MYQQPAFTSPADAAITNSFKMVVMQSFSTMTSNGRKFVILFAVFVISIFQLGSMKALGVFIPSFVEQLGMSETEAGLSCGIGIAVARILGNCITIYFSPQLQFLFLLTLTRIIWSFVQCEYRLNK